MRHPSGLLRLAAAVILTAAAGVALPVPAATAAACSSAAGVTVVVDFHELGGGVQQVCDAGSGQSAAARFVDAGFDLDRVQRQPGFVCRVDGLPADDPCVNTPPADAYWSLWWSNGESGTWTFASQGIDSLKVPDGGAVALSWKGSSESSPPGAAPPKQQTAPSASPSPSTPPSPPSSGGGSSTSGSQEDQPRPVAHRPAPRARPRPRLPPRPSPLRRPPRSSGPSELRSGNDRSRGPLLLRPTTRPGPTRSRLPHPTPPLPQTGCPSGSPRSGSVPSSLRRRPRPSYAAGGGLVTRDVGRPSPS